MLVISTLMITGCGAGKETNRQAFRYPLLDDPISLDPANFNEELGINVGKEIYDGLVDLDFEKLTVIPAHAEKWDVKENKVFTFYLRKGAKFHNGKEVTAEDFRYSFDRLLNPDTAATVAWILEGVKGAVERMEGKADNTEGIKVIDRYTLEITLEEPSPSFLSWLAHPGAAVVDRDTVEKAGVSLGSTGAGPDVIIGSGPFMLSEWVPKNQIRLSRNDEYYGQKAFLEQVEFRIIPDATTALNEFRAGNLDIVTGIPPGQIQSVEKEFPGQVIKNTLWEVKFFGFNLSREPFKDNVKLRRALNFAIDREGIINAVLEGDGVPAKGVLPPGMAEYNDDLKGYDYNPEKAISLLSEAGFPEGKGLPEVELAFNQHETNQKIAEAVQAQLKEVGFRTKLKGMPLPEYQREVGTGSLNVFWLSWIADSMDAGCILYPLFSSGGYGLFGYANQEVDTLLDRAKSAVDQDERIRLYREAEKLIVDDSPAIWIFHPRRTYLKAGNISGFQANPMDIIPMDKIQL
jgi:peptide/nickel transport system substrate-binding protein/oligopeptide transport system substrate-binding protein